MSVVNTETGEMVAVSPEEHAAVSRLQTAITALTEFVDDMPLAEVVELRAQVVTIQTATKELQMSKNAQEIAAEAVRRCEWRVGQKIREGQANGTVRRNGQHAFAGNQFVRNDGASLSETSSLSPSDLVPGGQALAETYALAEADSAAFEQALEDARAEGNLSRRNVVRKIKQQAGPTTRTDRADLIADLAAQGYSSRQMPSKVGVTEVVIRRIARDFDIDIAADRVVGKSRRIDHNAAIESAVTELDNWASSLTFIDFAEVDFTEADEWVSSLTNSLTELRRFIKQIKEQTHV